MHMRLQGFQDLISRRRHGKYLMLHHKNLPLLTTNPVAMDRRLRARLSPWELLALVLALSMGGLFVWVHVQAGSLPYDYDAYTSAGQGNLLQHYYMDWILPLYWLFAALPMPVGYLIWMVLGILCVSFAARVFGGNLGLAVLSYQMLYVMFLGQITGILIGGLALAWWSMAHKRWYVAGVGFLIALTKLHIGVLGLFLWLLADISWQHRLRSLIVPILAGLALFVINPSWPLDMIARLQSFSPIDWASIALWRWLGPVALLLWLPPLLLPLERQSRFLALMATCPLALPYFQQADLLALFVLPVGWLPILLGNLGYLFVLFQYRVLVLLWIVPLVTYAAIVLPAFLALIQDYRSRHGSRSST
jgi:hypothetical protein